MGTYNLLQVDNGLISYLGPQSWLLCPQTRFMIIINVMITEILVVKRQTTVYILKHFICVCFYSTDFFMCNEWKEREEWEQLW